MATLRPQAEADRARAEAGDPATSPARLRQLARHRRRAVREAVAANPNIDRRTIELIGAAFPEALARNPLLEWLVVEDADFLGRWPAQVRARVLMVGGEGLLWWAARFGTSEDRAALLANPKTPAALLAHLAEHDTSWAASLALAHVCAPAPGDTARPLPAENADDIDELFLLDLMPPWLLAAAAQSNDVRVRRHAARDRRTPAAAVRDLLIDSDETVRTLAALHPAARSHDLAVLRGALAECTPDDYRWLASTPSGTSFLLASHTIDSSALLLLAGSPVWQTRQAVAASASLTEAIAVQLMLDSDLDVRAALAANQRCPDSVRAVLHHDRDQRVRDAAPQPPTDEALSASLTLLDERDERAHLPLARHPLAPPQVLTRLAAAGDWRVRESVAGNPATPAEALSSLCTDSDADVRAAAAANPALPLSNASTMMNDSSARVRAASAGILSDPKALIALAADDDVNVRAAVARNASTPHAVLLALAAAAPPELANALFERDELPSAVFDSLALTSDDSLRLALWRDHRTPLSALARLTGSDRLAVVALALRDGETPAAIYELVSAAPWLLGEAATRGALDAAALAALGRSPDWRLRERAAQQSTDAAQLARLAEDADFDVRVAVARNQATGRETLLKLALDSSSPVRMAVAARSDIPPRTIARLLADEDEQVTQVALANPRLPAKARDDHVALVSGLPLAAGVLGRAVDGPPSQQVLAAQHPHVSRGQVDRLARNDNWRVREAAARSRAAAPLTLRSLSNDSDRDVRRGVAENGAAPSAVIERLAADNDDSVRRAALANPALTPECRARLQRRLVLRLARQGSGAALAAAAASPLLPRWFARRRRFWQATDWWVRLGTASNPNCEADLRDVLSNDGIVWVREAASS